VCALKKEVPETTHSRALSTPKQLLGIPPHETQVTLQQDAFKELVNKLAWALGSTYRVPYANTRTAARQYAISMAGRVVEIQGYPSNIAK